MRQSRKPAVMAAIFLASRVLLAAPATNIGEMIQANNTFTIDLFKQLSKQSGNLIISPFSVNTALAMAYAGARGETAAQIAGVLHLQDGNNNIHHTFGVLLKQLNQLNTDGNQFIMVNSLWAQNGYPFLKTFQKLLHFQYSAELNEIDLTGWPGAFDPAKATAAREKINDWVATQTRNKISDILPEMLPDQNTRLFLADAVYFKGTWSNSFDQSLTKGEPFYVNAIQMVTVPTMHKTEMCKYSENDYLQVLEMPYRSDRFSMFILLPKTRDGLAELENSSTIQVLDQLREASYSSEVDVSLPKFKISSGFDLIRPLQNLGMTDAFNGGADFSGMTKVHPFFIQAVLHKACVEVDENGAEASASTAIALADSKQITFNANHPFLFLIKDNSSGIILFMGRIINPQENS